ncbi:TPA: acyltransferase, partial [Citrobacter farmeri]|nr:acyltransferase [Citrobacter farmeri]
NHNTIWPGYAAITPVLGTCVIITANSKKSFYELPPLQYIGKLSYSIYLIHWPVLIISRDIFQKTNIVYYAIIVLLASIISYKIIEDRKKVGVCFVIPFLAICAFSYYVSIDGVKNRVDEKFTLSAKEYHHKYYGGFGFANDGGVQYINSSPDKSDFIISGDSYARQYLRFLKNSNRSFISIMKDGCFVSEKYISHFNIEMDNQCISRLNNLTIVMKKYPTKPVVIAQSWKDYTNKISKKDSHVIVSNEKN